MGDSDNILGGEEEQSNVMRKKGTESGVLTAADPEFAEQAEFGPPDFSQEQAPPSNVMGKRGTVRRTADIGYQTEPLSLQQQADAGLLTYVKPDLPPVSQDLQEVLVEKSANLVVSRMAGLQENAKIGDIINTMAAATQDVLQLPELLMWQEGLINYWVENPENSPTGSALLTELSYGSTEGALRALYEVQQERGFEPVSDAALRQPNVSTFLSENKTNWSPEMTDFVTTILASVPTTEISQETPSGSGAEFTGSGTIFAPFLSLFARSQEMGRNYREELAFDAAQYLRNKPINTEADQREFLTWMWMHAEQLNEERTGRNSTLGQIGRALDLPKDAVTAGVNKTLVNFTIPLAAQIIPQIQVPTDTLNYAHASFGEIIAEAMGTSISDEMGSSVLNHPIARPFANILKYGINAVPGVGVFSLGRMALTDGGAVRTPIVADVVDAYENSTTFQLVSGSADFVSWLIFDPMNYAASAGFGAKQAGQVFRAPNLSRGRQLMQSLIPFYGSRITGLRGGVTARVTGALLSQTADDWIDAARAGGRGRDVLKAIRAADTAEEAARRVPVLKDNPITPILFDAAKRNDDDFFWETLRAQINGAYLGQNPTRADELRGVLNSVDRQTQQSVQEALDAGEIGIRDARIGALGNRGDSVVYEAVPASNRASTDVERIATITVDGERANPGVVESVVRNAGRLKNADEVGRVGDVVVRRSGRQFAAFDANTGEVLGGLDLASKQIASSVEGRRIADILADVAEAQQDLNRGDVVDILASTTAGRTEAFVGWANKRRAAQADAVVLRAARSEGDQAVRAIINTKLGWSELNLTDRAVAAPVIEWLNNAGETDLALKISLIVSNDMGAGALTPDDLAKLQRFADNVASNDAVRIGDQLIVAGSSRNKILTGFDRAERTPLNNIERLKDPLNRAADAYYVKQMLGGRHREVALIDSMPRVKRTPGALKALSRWTGMDGSGRVAQFGRRVAAGVKENVPQSISFRDPSSGAADLRRSLRLLGVKQSTIDEIMTDWWAAGRRYGDSATGIEERRKVAQAAFIRAGQETNQPHLANNLIQWPNRHGGSKGAGKGTSGAEIGSAIDDAGREHVVPVIRAHHQDEMVVPDLMGINRMRTRFKNSKIIPRRLVEGYGTTARKRKDLVQAYKQSMYKRGLIQRVSPYDPKTDQELLRYAYADVLGYAGREDGLGKVDWAAGALVGKPYKFFTTSFTIAQLAFRPFAWSSRVLLEEHHRAWLMGLPTIISNPTMYAINFWDNHMLTRVKKLQSIQRDLGLIASAEVFPSGKVTDEALALADEFLPGWSSRLAEQGVDASDGFSLRQLFAHDLGKALSDGNIADLGAADAIARRTFLSAGRSANERAAVIRRVRDRMQKNYGIDPTEFDFATDAAEMANRSNVWLLSDEMQSSIKEVEFSKNLRPEERLVYADSYAKRTHQVLRDQGVRYALNRKIEKLRNAVTLKHDALGFMRSSYWKDVKDNIRQVARYRGLDDLSEEQLVEFYLDEVLGNDIIENMFKGFWGDNPNEKLRILDELAAGKNVNVNVGNQRFTLGLRPENYASGKAEYRRAFLALADEGNFQFPEITGFFNPNIANYNTKNPFRWFTNRILQTFGEDVSQTLHRRPAYLYERSRWKNTLERMGWDPADADRYAHQKAFEMVNYTFFNNQHTGVLLHRMNKVIPFFSAWAEVMGTWAWKIPSQNYLPLGYANMIHKMERMLQGFVKIGLVEQMEDGQWVMNLEADPDAESPLGQGLSRGMREMMAAPVTFLEHAANVGRLVNSFFTDEDFEGVDFSAWKKDNYQLAIGSPVRVNSHGIMGVNQFSFGLNPALSYGTYLAENLPFINRLSFAGDTELVEGNNLEEMLDKLPPSVGAGQFIEYNKEAIIAKIGQDQYDLLWEDGREFLDFGNVDMTGVSLQVPGSSWLDGTIAEDLFFPFGQIQTPEGVLRSLVPGSLSYMFRGLGVFVDDQPMVEGLINILTGPIEQSQIDGLINKELLHLESTEGLISEAANLSAEIERKASDAGFDNLDDFRAALEPGSPESAEFAELERRRESLDNQIAKRAIDNAGWSLFARGLMGLFGPASPRMQYEEQKATAMWWSSKEMADAATVRGSMSYADLMRDTDISDADDLTVLMANVANWLEDDTGTTGKVWLRDNYPSLLAWTNPTTYWAPDGPPGQVQDIDAYFDQVQTGSRQALPYDVLMQKVARGATEISYESQIRLLSNSDDPRQQGLWALQNPQEYEELRENRRLKYRALDMWDSELNDGAYDEWRSRNEEAPDQLFERWEDEMFIIQNSIDQILNISDSLALLPADEQRDLQYKLDNIGRSVVEAINSVKDDLAGLPDEWRSERDEIITKYFTDVAAPYYENVNKIQALIAQADNNTQRSALYEELRVYQNEVYLNGEFNVEMSDGEIVEVPSPMERSWLLAEPEEQRNNVRRWMSQNVEWLNLFKLQKIADVAPAAAEYLPMNETARAILDAGAEAKRQIRLRASQDRDETSRYDRSQELAAIDKQVEDALMAEGLEPVVKWMNAWPMEKLVWSEQLPPAMKEIAGWYMGVRQILDANDKGPQSEMGRAYWDRLITYLEAPGGYYNYNPAAREAIDELGIGMFGENQRYAVYARLWGQFVGEFD